MCSITTCLSDSPVAAQQACRARGHHIDSLVHAVKVDRHLVVLANCLSITRLQVVEPSAILCKWRGTGLRMGKQVTERDRMSQAVQFLTSYGVFIHRDFALLKILGIIAALLQKGYNLSHRKSMLSMQHL